MRPINIQLSHGTESMGGERSYYRYWGKAAKDDSGESLCHLLPYHSLDVAAVGKALLTRNPVLHEQLAKLTGLSKASFSQWMVWFLALHDLGKFADSFQNLCPDLLGYLQQRVSKRAYAERHDTLGYLLWDQRVRLAVQKTGILPDSGGSRRRPVEIVAADVWVRAVTGHHGQPPKMVNPVFRDFFDEPHDTDAAIQFVDDVRCILMPDKSVFPVLDVAHMKAASWWLAGFTVLCDWLGSGRDPSTFQPEAVNLNEYWQTIQGWAADVVAQSGLLPTAASTRFQLSDCFPGAAGDEIDPTPLQEKVSQLKIEKGPQLFILEDVTGAGKTEAAVLLAHRLMQVESGAGVYFGLPTMATSNAMYQRIGAIYRKMFSSESAPSIVLAHSARDLSDAFRLTVADREGEYPDGLLSASAHCNAWLADNRKKALLAAVGVGTIDQALLATLPSRHQSLRLLGLLGKVLIVDEVHACDAYMQTLLRGLLAAHASAGGSAILLSATLPQAQRQGLVDAFLQGIEGAVVEAPLLSDQAYPLLTHAQSRQIEQYPVQTRRSVRRRVEVRCLETEDAVVEVIQQAVEQGRCVCWIRNTVADARKSWQKLTVRLPECPVALFHARYAMSDRLTIENRVLDYFGPDSTPDQRRGRVLVATQVVEQSLDLDFDLMVSDLAPIDLIIQRAGRLHRHRRDESGQRIDNGTEQRGTPALYLLTPPWAKSPDTGWLRDAMPGTAAVYRDMDGQLWLGLHLLRETGGFAMPDDARHMIESVYCDDALSDIPEALQGAALAEEGKRRAQHSQAELNLLKIASGYQREESNIWWDEAMTPTRLGEASTTVYLARYENGELVPWAGGGRYAWMRSAVSIRKVLIAGTSESSEIPAHILDAVQEKLPAKGKWGVLLPMLLEKGKDTWIGKAENGHGETVSVYYEPRMGLMTEKDWRELEVTDESDI